MPHKRAKFSVRQSEREKHGTDLPPTGGVPLARESIPKSMARVLQAEGVRRRYREKRTRLEDDNGVGTKEREPKRRKTDDGLLKPLEIKHGESLAHYNRRVEEEMRIPVAEAMQTSRTTAKRATKFDKAAKIAKLDASKLQPPNPQASIPDLPATPLPARKTEFAKRPTTTRLNDIVQAPPNLTTLPRGAAAKRKAHGGGSTLSYTQGVVSMAQRQKMEEEREKAIKRYRELKELKAAA